MVREQLQLTTEPEKGTPRSTRSGSSTPVGSSGNNSKGMTTGFLLFRHRVLLAGLEGELSIYQHQIAYTSSSNANDKNNYAFAFIKTIKYFGKPDDKEQRVMMMVELNDSSKAVFNLIGSSKDQCRMELERLRTVIADVRRGAVAAESAMPAALPSSSSMAAAGAVSSSLLSKTQRLIANANTTDSSSTSSSKHKHDIDEARRQLLNADKELAKTYKDLVTVSRVFTDQEFWDNHLLLPERDAILTKFSSGSAAANPRAKVTNLLSDLDIVKDLKTGGSKFNINLTVEMKAEIFSLYPPVKKAFVAEVPVHMTEADFWLKFFQSEYYSRDKNYKSVNRGGHSDDLFSRYAADSSADGSGKDRASSGKTRERQKNISGLVDGSCDLTLQEGDFHVLGSTDREDASVAPEISKDIINKYNKHSSSFFASDTDVFRGRVGGARTTRFTREDNCMTELQTNVQPSYIPLIVSRNAEQNSSLGDAAGEDSGSAFVKASSIVKRQALKVVAVDESTDSISAAISTDRAINRLFPSTEKAMKYIEDDINHKRSFTAVAKSAARKLGSTGHDSAIADVGLTVLDMVDRKRSRVQNSSSGTTRGEGDDLDQQLREEMYERFNTVAELLRHLYSILSKDSPGGAALEKGMRIAEKLASVREALERKEAAISLKGGGAAASAVVDGVIQLINRAESKWRKVTNT